MTLSQRIVVASEPAHVFRALVHPGSLQQWWGCTAVIDPRAGGTWVGGWGEGQGGYGHQTVIFAELSRFDPGKAITLKMGSTEIHLDITPDIAGSGVTVAQTGFPASSPEEDAAALESWVDMVRSLKGWVETKHPYTRPAAPPPPSAPPQRPVATPQQAAPQQAAPQQAAPQQAAPQQAAPQQAAPQPQSLEITGMSDPYGAREALAQGGIRVLDDGGFGVSDPNAVIKSWSKEQGFGYATHPQLGDVVFDYDGCDFEPAPGDRVLLLVIAKAWNGKPKVKRIACPAKGSKIDK